MSRRVLAPVLLLLAAACSMAAVFAVHRIEANGGPLSQPSASTFFSPDGDGVQDEAEVRFTTHKPEHVTIEVVTRRGERVRRLMKNQLVDGPTTVAWDGNDEHGKRVAKGSYRFRITRSGDARTYSPTTLTTVDVTPPIGVLDRATLELGKLRGLAMLGPNEQLEVFARSGALVEGLRQFSPNPDSQGAQPVGDAPDGTKAVRFTIALDGTPGHIDVVDKAGNRSRVFPSVNVQYEAKG